MSFSQLMRTIMFIMAAILLISTSGPTQANMWSDFSKIDKELRIMHENQLFKGGKTRKNAHFGNILGKGELVAFDSQAARKEGFSEKSIAIAEQLADFTNELLNPISAQQHSILLASNIQNRYPALAAYFARATTVARQASQQPQVISRVVCGWYTNPRPSQAAPWREWDRDNPDQTLKSWGYHSTPNLAGGGYTRAQTWSWWNCGFGTYRDHAYVLGSRTIREQNYDGWSPRGEPNPEVYASGPWPYADWPAYVYWWHRTY